MHNTYYTRPPFRYRQQKSVWEVFMTGLRRFMGEWCHD
jgi:hypothetical protein